jgi:DNA-binding transcriptional MerR regulator
MGIGDVAREFGVTVRALRFYEAKRLVCPLRRGALRLYRRSVRERLARVLAGRRLGFTLAEIADLLQRAGGANLHLTRAQCVAQIRLLEQQKRGLEIAIAELRQMYTAFYVRQIGAGDARSGAAPQAQDSAGPLPAGQRKGACR